MGKNYKRHAKAERFQRANFGDMGLRAYREQQQTIIDSLKLQNKEFESTRKEFIDDEIDKNRKELENDKELKKLEDAVWQNKFDNKLIADDRQIKALEADLEGYKMKSEYWADFSSTYAEQYANAFNKVKGVIDLKMAKNAFDKILNDDSYHERLEETEFLEFFQAADADKYLDKTLKEKAQTIEEKRKKVSDVVGIQRYRGGTEQRIAVDDLIGRTDDIITALLRDVENPDEGEGITVDQYNVKDIIEYRGLEVLAAEGIRWNSKEGMRFMKHIQGKALQHQKRRKNLSEVDEDEDNITATVGEIKTYKKQKDYKNYEVGVNKLMKQLGTQKVYDKKSGKFGIIPMNPKQKFLAAMEVLADHGVITNTQEAEKFGDIAHPDQKHIGDLVGGNIEAAKKGTLKDNRRTWWQRHPTLMDEVGLILAERNAASDSKAALKKAQADTDGVAFVENGLKDGSIDVTNKPQINKLIEEYSIGDKRGTGKTLQKLNEIAVFSKIGIGKNGAILNPDAITALSADGKTEEFRSLISMFPKETRATFDQLLDDLEFADRVGLDQKGIKEYVFGHLNKVQKLKSINEIKDGDFSLLIKDAIQDVRYQIARVNKDNSKNDTQKLEEITRTIKERIEGKIGIYARDEDKGANTVWTAYNDGEKGNTISAKTIKTKLNDARVSTESFIKEVEKGNIGTVFKQDNIDSWEKSILKGESFATPDLVEVLWLRQSKGDDFQTRTQIFNRLLKAEGASFQLPPGEEEHDLWIATKVVTQIHRFKNKSLEDRQRIACASEILDLGDTEMCKQRVAKETAEREALENYNYMQNNVVIENQYEDEEIKAMNKPNKPKRKLPWFMRPVDNSTNPVRLNRL